MRPQTKIILYKTIIFLLVVLWVYTAGSKFIAYREFKTQLAGQYIFRGKEALIGLAIILSELLTATLLIFKSTRSVGLKLSLFLMLTFTTYIGLVLVHYFDQVPCSCGGVLKQMGWKIHFLFNLFFTLLAGLGIYLNPEENPSSKSKPQSNPVQ